MSEIKRMPLSDDSIFLIKKRIEEYAKNYKPEVMFLDYDYLIKCSETADLTKENKRIKNEIR